MNSFEKSRFDFYMDSRDTLKTASIYRVYFIMEKTGVIKILTAGTKKTQKLDIAYTRFLLENNI